LPCYPPNNGRCSAGHGRFASTLDGGAVGAALTDNRSRHAAWPRRSRLPLYGVGARLARIGVCASYVVRSENGRSVERSCRWSEPRGRRSVEPQVNAVTQMTQDPRLSTVATGAPEAIVEETLVLADIIEALEPEAKHPTRRPHRQGAPTSPCRSHPIGP
jgi:hypothetical protein